MSSKNNISKLKYIPTFFLKCINFKDIQTKLKEGYFFRPIPEKVKIDSKKSIKIFKQKPSQSFEDAIYSIYNKNNQEISILTSNHEKYKYVTENSGELPCGGTCKFCLRTFEHQVIGYPIAYDEKFLLKDGVSRLFYIFWITGTFCRYQCVYDYLLSINSIESIQTFLFMYKITNPDGENLFRRNSDPELLKSNYGSMEYDDWANSKFYNLNKPILLPAKNQYVKINN